MSVLTQPPPPQLTHPVTRSQLVWLERQVRDWQADGILDEDQAGRIVGRYRADHRFPLSRLLLTIGAVFIGVGVIWLVAANIDSLTPTTRFVAISLVWLAALAGAEVLASTRDTDRSSPVVGAIRLMAALAFGGVIFQAAQSLQVPAYEPALVGFWAIGALLQAYAFRALLPLVVAILTGSTWFGWQVLPESDSGLTVVVCLVTVAVAALAVAGLHARWAAELATPWRELGATFLLVGLFTAALPFVDSDDFLVTSWMAGAGAVALALAGAAVVASAEARWEVLGAVTAAGAACGLAVWEIGDDVLHAAVGVTAYVLVAVGVAVVGAVRESWRLTAIATVGLVVFTTFQSFSVFARILEGAWLFVALGTVFLGTGYVFDQARRHLVAVVVDDEPSTSSEGQTR